MENDKDQMYFCPPKLTPQFRFMMWDIYDFLIGIFIGGLGAVWHSYAFFAIGLFVLLLKMHISDEKSIYTVLKSIFLYIVTPQSYSQYID